MKLIYKIAIGLFLFIVAFLFLNRMIHQPAPPPEITYLHSFEAQIKASIESAASEYGTIRILEPRLGFNADEVCFLQTGEVILKLKGQIRHSFSVESMTLESDFCVNPIDDKIKIRIEGIGETAKVSEYIQE